MALTGMLTQRRLTPEHMDDPHATRDDLGVALEFLRMANRRLCGASAALRQFKRWAEAWDSRSRHADARSPSPQPSPKGRGGGPIRILDIGCGSADIPLAIARWARAAGHRVAITAVDLHPVTCELAREYLRREGGEAAGDIDIMQADALRLTDQFDAGAFDYAHAGLFLHHLPDIEVLTVLTIMDRLAARGMIWNDLVRVRFPRAMMLPILIGAPAIVKHDAIVSVQAGFTRAEAIDLAGRAGWRRPVWRRHLVHRFTLASTKSV